MNATCTTCDICGDPVTDNAYVCTRERDSTATGLRFVIDVAPDVQVTVAGLARYGDRGGYSLPPVEPDTSASVVNRRMPVEAFGWPASKDRPKKGALRSTATPVNLNAAQRADQGVSTITTWARHVVTERGVSAMPAVPAVGPTCGAVGPLDHCSHSSCGILRARGNGAATAAWILLHQLDWLRHRPEAAQAFDDLAAAAATIRRVVDAPPELWYAGPCWQHLDDAGHPVEEPASDGDRCDAELYALATDGTVRCHGCGTRHDVAARRKWLLGQTRGVLMHAAWMAAAITALDRPVTASMIRNYADRGRIAAHGTDERGRPVYVLGEVLDLLTRMDRTRHKEAA